MVMGFQSCVWSGPRLHHIFIRLGPTPPTPPSLPGLPAHTCVGTLPRWEPMWQYPITLVIKGHFTHEIESPWPLQFKHSYWWKRQTQSKIASHYAWGTDGVRECMMNIKSTWVPTWHQMDHVSWSLGVFSKVGLAQNQETMALQTLTSHNCWLILFYHVWGPIWIETHWNSIRLTARDIWLHTTLEGPWPHYMILEVCWDGPWTLYFGLSQFPDHGFWLVCEVTVNFFGHVKELHQSTWE